MSELIVHIGLPKTGTTAIQRYMYANKADYAEAGVFWANTHPNGIHEINDWAHHIYSHKWGGWIDPSTFPVKPDVAWEMLADEMRKQPGRYIVSSERFADILPLPFGADALAFIRDLVAPAQVKLIGYVRRQDSLIESHIKELVKGGQMRKSLPEYLAELPSFVFFEKGFQTAQQILGADNVTMRVYERSLLAREDVVSDFLEACRLPVITDPKDVEELANPSLSTVTTMLLLDPRVNKLLAENPKRGSALYAALRSTRFEQHGDRALLGPHTRTELMARFKQGNDQLSQMFPGHGISEALSYNEADAPEGMESDTAVLSVDDLIELLTKLSL